MINIEKATENIRELPLLTRQKALKLKKAARIELLF